MFDISLNVPMYTLKGKYQICINVSLSVIFDIQPHPALKVYSGTTF